MRCPGTPACAEFLINGVPQSAGHAINVPSGDGGPDTLWAQLIRGNETAGGWQEFTVTDPASRTYPSDLAAPTIGALSGDL
jgi:hypothetical protein